MVEMNHKERDRNVVLAFQKEGLKVHVSLKNGIFHNGHITRVFEEFFILDDKIHGPTNVFFDQLKKPPEEFTEVQK